MTADDHGSSSTYCNHRCRCEACTDAHRISQYGKRIRRSRRLASDPVLDVEHGRQATYLNWGCRCAPCTEEHRVSARRRRAAARACQEANRD